jgi:hypothetical protein
MECPVFGDLPFVVQPDRSGPRPARLPAQAALRVHRARDADRLQVERFIECIYAEHYDAQIADVLRDAPNLVSVAGSDGAPVAAAGYRSAGRPLFLERYLGLPVEEAIAAVTGIDLPRAEIVEVGHFASGRVGEGRRLMALLGRHLAGRGYTWVVSTATQELRTIFARLGIVPHALGRAHPAVLGEGAARWGSYYAHAPLVLAGEIRSNLARVEHRG